MNPSDFSIITLIATVVVTVGVPAMVGLTWNMSNRLAVLVRDHTELTKRVNRVEKHVGLETLALAAMLGLLCTHAPGCSRYTDRIRDGASSVRMEADAGIVDLTQATATGEIGPKARPFIESAATRFATIGRAAGGIASAAAHVQDVGGWWSSVRSFIVWALVIAAIVLVGAGFLWAFIPVLVRRLVLWIPALAFIIPRGIADAAKLTLESRDDPAKLDELIAAKRAASPTFDAMYRTLKKKRAKPAGV